MKTFILLFCTAVFSFNGENVFSQQKVMIENDQDATIRQVFKIIQRQTNYDFIYPKKLFVNAPKVKLEKGEILVEDLLKKALTLANFNFELSESNAIIISEKVTPIDDNIQITEVSGQVVDRNGAPIPGVTISVKGTDKGVVTDFDGNYTIIEISANDVLVFSYVGMQTQEIAIGSQSTINITLLEDLVGLEQVVVIGYGTAKKADLSSSIATVSGLDKINSRPSLSISDFLQGNVAGVTVVQNGGSPVSSPSVVIRGIGTLSNETPLFVVDGMPYYGGPINPNDIESVSILKDAAAAAIYGAQAASGVIVVTTKSGKSGKPRVNVEISSGFYIASNLPTPLTAQEQSAAYNQATDNAGVGRLPAHDPVQNPWGAINRTNWIDAIFRDALFTNASVTFSGGNDKGNYMTSFNFQDREGTLVGTSSKRLILRLKGDFNISDKITIGENVNITRTDGNGVNTSSSYSGAIINAMYMPSAAPVYDEFGNFHGVAPEGSAFAGAYGDVYNPVALLLRPTVDNPSTQINANAFLNYNIIEGLKFRSAFSIDLLKQENKTFTPQIPESGRRTLQNYLDQSWTERYIWNWDNQISYEKNFGKHHLDLTAVYSAQYTNFESSSVEAQDFLREESWYQYLRNARDITSWGSSAYEEALTSAIGRVRYNFDNKYYIAASIRQDETSKLVSGSRKDVFPSVSGAWRISSESFMENVDWLSNLKLRASWGQIGNIRSVNSYAFNIPISSTRSVYLGRDAERVQAYFINSQSNPNLKWETSETTDFGLDASLFKGKLELTADYFKKTTKDMILINAPNTHTGVSNGPPSNVGTVENVGYEFSVNYRNFDKALKYSVGMNLSSIKNELIDLGGYTSDNISHSDDVRSSLRPFRSEAGQPLYSYYLVPWEGIFNNQAEIDSHQKDGNLIQPNAVPGDFKFTDTNDDGVISDDDRVYHGNAFPKITYAVNANLEYKNFDLFVFFQGVEDINLFNGAKYSTYAMNEQTYNRDNRILNAWTPSNQNTDIPRLSTLDNNRNFGTNSTWYLEDGSYLRLKNITLGYTLPKSVFDHVMKGASLRAYLSGENLFTITNYSGIDPEVGGIGLDVSGYPVSKVYSVGLSLTF
ncbi:SusC/RagA family TonB-linked outer membrane protein [Aestuariivivens sediminicola]|nr:TonB-dependent receptor [Aestuariivivens sediminicola]